MPIYDLHGPPISNHATLMEISTVHSMPTIYYKQEHSFYKMSAADMIRYQCHLHDPSPQPSSFATAAVDYYSSHSVTSSVSDSTTNTDTTIDTTMSITKKRSHERLLREIRRLRSENTNLQNSVNILKEDLRHERESRQIAEQCHRKFFDESMDTHTRLNLEIMDQQEQLLAYQSRLTNTTHSISTIDSSRDDKNRLDDDVNVFDGDYWLWGCEDMDCSNERRCHSDTQNDFDMDMNNNDGEQHSIFDQQLDSDEEDNSDDSFEDLAISHLQQALINNWTSTRAHLEFDDLILKHDPSSVKVLRSLADAFFRWIRETIHTSATSCTTTSTNDDEKATCVARLMTTQVQDVFLRFWKNVLERYVHNDEDQYQFLQQIEWMLHHHYNPNNNCQQQQQQQSDESYYIVQNFHRILVMLYKYDIIDDDALVHWWHGHLLESYSLDKDDGDNNDYYDVTVADQLRNVTRKFVEWLEQEENDDDNNNDDDSDDDDDDDDYQYDNKLYGIGDDLYSGLLEPTLADDSNASRTPIQPVDKKKKSVTILV